MTSAAPVSLYERIADDVLRRVVAGELRPGDRLPPVRQAARLWGVNLNTVSRAYALLAQRGVLQTRAGGGTLVAASPDDAGRWGADPVAEARAERLRTTIGAPVLLALGLGYSADEIEAAVSMQLARWRRTPEAESAASPVALAGTLAGDPSSDTVSAPVSAHGSVSDTSESTLTAPDLVRFVGSHDLSLELLAGRLHERLGDAAGLHLTVSGSLEGLFSLAHGTADVAGCHLRDPESGDDNLPFVRRVLPGEPLLLVTLAHREQGLIVAQGNPKAIEGVADLGRADVRFVNRQRGSGTRVLLDELLRVAGLAGAAIDGYEREEATHLAVAGAVASDAADVGLGIRAAARTCGTS